MFSLSPRSKSSVRYYAAAHSQQKSAWRNRRRARRPGTQLQEHPTVY